MKNKKNVALFYPWLHLYGGGEVFAEYTTNKLSKKTKLIFIIISQIINYIQN